MIKTSCTIAIILLVSMYSFRNYEQLSEKIEPTIEWQVSYGKTDFHEKYICMNSTPEGDIVIGTESRLKDDIIQYRVNILSKKSGVKKWAQDIILKEGNILIDASSNLNGTKIISRNDKRKLLLESYSTEQVRVKVDTLTDTYFAHVFSEKYIDIFLSVKFQYDIDSIGYTFDNKNFINLEVSNDKGEVIIDTIQIDRYKIIPENVKPLKIVHHDEGYILGFSSEIYRGANSILISYDKNWNRKNITTVKNTIVDFLVKEGKVFILGNQQSGVDRIDFFLEQRDNNLNLLSNRMVYGHGGDQLGRMLYLAENSIGAITTDRGKVKLTIFSSLGEIIDQKSIYNSYNKKQYLNTNVPFFRTYIDGISSYVSFYSYRNDLQRVKGRITKFNFDDYISPPEPKVWVILMGVSEYENLNELQFVDDQIYELKEKFEEIGFGNEIFTKINYLISYDKFIPVIEEIICDSSRVKENDFVFIYFSGHGKVIPTNSGEGSAFGICPIDYKRNSKLLITQDTLLKVINRSPAKHKILVVEACQDIDKRSVSMSSKPNDDYIENDLTQMINEERTQFGKGTAVITSCRKGQSSRGFSNSLKENGGWFTISLKKAIFECEADGVISGVKDGVITLEELFEYLKVDVSEFAKGEGYVQIPQMYNPTLSGNFPVVRCSN